MNKITKSNRTFLPNSFAIDEIAAKKSKAKNNYEAISNGVKISVLPEFINSQDALLGDLYIWSYKIKIENQRVNPIKLINRHWKIIDQKGGVQKVDGEGVVGKQPEILVGEVFEYDSGVHLTYPSGIMSGHYEMRDCDGEFLVEIPAFSLDAAVVNGVMN